jgi:hypothetical protein
VESQEDVATNSLVDNADEQAVLEDLIETSKPPDRPGTGRVHFLLRTPFRYPPLPHGSRFGSRFEPSIFYGSHTVDTTLAECAYYRFVFWTGMAEPPPAQRIVSQHTVFSASYRTRAGVKLQQTPFAAFEQDISNPARYSESQQLGTELRKQGVEACEYVSARDTGKGINVALFAPTALARPYAPRDRQAWTCTTKPDSVTFFEFTDRIVKSFAYADFLVAGVFPVPAP